MKFLFSVQVIVALAAGGAHAAYVPSASSLTWTTLSPTATPPASASAVTNFDGSFALSIKTVSSDSSAATSDASDAASGSSAAMRKRDDIVTQISDGQLQQGTSSAESTVDPETTTASVINQISDGQIQDQTTTTADAETTASVINQISDGQIQDQTTTTSEAVTTASVVNQISDGQIQQQTTTTADPETTTASVVNQISDGQIQDQTTTTADSVTTASVADQISDGQIQQQTTVDAESVTASGDSTSSSTSTSSSDDDDDDDDDEYEETCVTSSSLTVQLNEGILTDAEGRIGAIVANHQFQFDGPPPQAGSIYAAGWSIVDADYLDDSYTKRSVYKRETEGHKLALGTKTTFYKCLSGTFYNLYDESIGGQCTEVELYILKAVDC